MKSLILRIFYCLILCVSTVTAYADAILPTMKSPDGRFMISGNAGKAGTDTPIRVRDIAPFKIVYEHSDNSNYYVKPIGFTSDSRLLIETCKNRCNEYSATNTFFTIVDVSRWKEICTIPGGLYSQVSLQEYNSNKVFMYSESNSGNNLKLYDITDGSLIRNFDVGPVKKVIPSSDGTHAIVMLKNDKNVKVVNLENGSMSDILLEEDPGNAAFFPKNSTVVFGFKGYAAIYDIQSGRLRHKFSVDQQENCAGNCADDLRQGTIAFSPTGKLLTASAESGATYVWDVGSDNRLWKLVLPYKDRKVVKNSRLTPYNAKYSPDESEILLYYPGAYIKGFSLVDGSELGELQNEKRRILTNKAKEFEPQLSKLGISKRVGFKSGDIRERFVPPVTNSYYNTETLYYVGSTPVTKTTSSTYTSESYREKVVGYTAIYEIKNQSNSNYIVDVILDGTVKNSNWKVYSSWFGDNFREKSVDYEHLTVNKKILLKAGSSLKDQIVVGEEEPNPFIVGVVGVTPVDSTWIHGLDRGLLATIKDEKTALEVLPVLEKYIADPVASPWVDKLKSNKKIADDILKAAMEAKYKKLVKVTVRINADYDPDFANDVDVVISNSSNKVLRVKVSMPDNQEFSADVLPAKSYDKKIQIKSISKKMLKATIVSIDPI